MKPSSPNISALTTGLFYAVMAAVAALWSSLLPQGMKGLLALPQTLTVPWWSAGLGAAVLLIGSSELAQAQSPAMRVVASEMCETMAPFTWPRAIWFALTSGLAEEALFRGAAQATLGPWLTALVFALLHGGGRRRTLPWAAFALLAGVVLAGLVRVYGSLAPAVVAHVVVNAVNLRRLQRYAA